MTDLNHDTDTVAGVQVDIDGVERAARALAAADSKGWTHVEVRNRYRGLALAAIGAYVATPVAGEE